jgi:hypothetical protein
VLGCNLSSKLGAELSAAPRALVTFCKKTRVVSVMEPGRGPLVLKKNEE